MNLSLAVTHFNRPELLKQCFPSLVGVVDEIVIQDDCSTRENQTAIAMNHSDHAKIFYNLNNVGMSRNKAEAISNCENNWVIIADSDNIFTPAYIEALPKHLRTDTIYCPCFARPEFDFRNIGGVISAENIKRYLNLPQFEVLLNTCNYVVNKKKYLEVYRYNAEMKGTDTVWFAYLWLMAGNKFEVVPGMEYFHRIHDGSGFLKDITYNMAKAKEIRNLIAAL